MLLSDILPHFDGKKTKLAEALGVSRQAVSGWSLDQPIPERHFLKLKHEILPGEVPAPISALDAQQPGTDAQLETTAQQGDNKGQTKLFSKSSKLEHVLYDIRGPVLEEAHRLEDEGHRVLKLNIGNPGAFGFHAPAEIMQDVTYNLASAEGYTESQGFFAARKAVMQECQIKRIPNVGINDIYMGNGVSELIMMALQALLDYGDEVLVPAPDYPLWTAAVRLSGGTPVHYLCDEENDWQPDLDDLKAKMTPNTKAMVVINPNNPTGAVYCDDMLQQLAQIAEQAGLILFADEIYDKILYDDAKHTPMGSLVEDTLCVTFNGLSKSYRLAGFRSGWAIFSGAKERASDFIEGMHMMASMRLCANAPGQLAVQTALGGYQSIQDLVLPGGRLLEQRDIAWEGLNDIPGVTCVKPKGALYLFPRLDPKIYAIQDDEQLVLDLVRSQHLLLVQGTAFNWPHPDHLRVVFLPNKDDLAGAVDKFAAFLKKYRS